MKKCLSVLLVLAIVSCLFSICISSASAAEADSYYYYKVKVTTKIDGGIYPEAFNVYYSLHGANSSNQNVPLASFNEKGGSDNFSKIRFQAGATEQTDVLTYYSEKPVIGARFLQENLYLTGITSDENEYYLDFSEQSQQPGLENAMNIEQMGLIEGFKVGGELILSELRDSIFTVKYNTPPVISGVEDGGEYFTTQKVRVQDADLVSVMLNDQPVEFENGEAVITIPGNTNKSYTITVKDADWTRQLTVKMHELKELITPVTDINEKNVKAEDKDTLLATLDNINTVIAQESTPSTEEKSHIDTMKKELENLLSRIDEALTYKNSDNIENTKDITADTVKPTDKEALEKAEADLKKALEEYSEIYSDSEKKALQEDLARVSEALNVLKALEETIPEEVPESPKTGDNSYLALWLALFMLSGITLVTAKRKTA